MSSSDYRLCDLCGSKTFYDSDLNYSYEPSKYIAEQMRPREKGEDSGADYLDSLGDWAVICNKCAKTHKTAIVPRIS